MPPFWGDQPPLRATTRPALTVRAGFVRSRPTIQPAVQLREMGEGGGVREDATRPEAEVADKETVDAAITQPKTALLAAICRRAP
ncbi:hypothetical protein AWV80_35330 [Cupriavidus sp. UYMU48A]|nr:hypothetical protein AWV80_35330 [Cupriavidus sp. UYMU48A]